MSILDEKLKEEQKIEEVWGNIYSFCTDCQRNWEENNLWWSQRNIKPNFHWSFSACKKHAEEMRKRERENWKPV